jgi:replicative DNA helicase
MNDGLIGGPTPPHDEEAEAAVLGSLMLAQGKQLPGMFRIGLKAEHFYRPRNRLVYEAIVKLDDHGRDIDTITVQARLAADGQLEQAGGDDYVETLVTRIPSIAHAVQYAEIVMENARLRSYIRIGQELIESVHTRDVEGLAKAENALLTLTPTGRFTYDPDELGLMALEFMESDQEAFKTPWPRFNKLLAGGFRRGSCTVLSGYSSHGKSVIADQILEYVARQGFKAHLWINEMTPTDRTIRTIARNAHVSLDALLTGKLGLEEQKKATEAMAAIPFGITDCAGWTAQEIARDIRAKKPDIACVDIFQKIAGGQQTWELDEKSRILNDVPKESQANCHLILTAHVTKPAVRDGKPVKPNGSNLRGTGSLENDADYVVFVHRDTNEHGRRSDMAEVYATKLRSGGQQGGFKATFDGPHQEFSQFTPKKGTPHHEDGNEDEFPF